MDTRVILLLVDCGCIYFSAFILDILYDCGVKDGGCICVLLYVFEEDGRAGRFGVVYYTYFLWCLLSVGLYANMAAMPGVR